MSESKSTSENTSQAEQNEQGASEPLRSVHTSNLPGILDHFGISVMVSTYQAGRLVMLRSEGGVLNTHFRSFDKPMGLAIADNRLAVGAAMNIWEFHNIPAVSRKLDAKLANDPVQDDNADQSVAQADQPSPPAHRHDACFLPRTIHWTGDIQIHEMAWVGRGNQAQLWFVNTLFSCLCQRSDIYNFQPIWRPPFVTKYEPGDCCHLNGLGLRDGQPRYVTALGETDEPGKWRENKKDGGILIDLDSNEIILRGLSMPHSPRWSNNRLWLLESGTGSFGYVDPHTGRYEAITSLPGFTRGLSFIGPLAFIGLSQVRESAVFGGVPIAEKALEERICGVWVVNIESGDTVGYVQFEEAVQEIFAVDVVVGTR
jgi:uncharacterized protein (TIGR03032 family)